MPIIDSGILYLAAIGVFVLSLIIQASLKATFRKYSKVESERGITAEQAGRLILREADVNGIVFGKVSGELTDHYNPKENVINLSQSVSGSTSIAAIAVAAHECGHAIQNERNVLIYRLRQFLAPVAALCSSGGVYLAMAGYAIGVMSEYGMTDFTYGLMTIGICAYFVAVLFYLVMVPVEYDASNRALKIIKELGLVGDNQVRSCKKVLRAAGRTYVISLASAAITLLRLVSMRGRKRR